MKIKHLLAFASCCAAFGLVACGDDSSSNSTGGSGEVYKEAKASIITLDEQNKTIVAYESRKKDYCVVDELTETASWKTVDRGNDTSTVEYEFISLAENELSFVRDSLKLSVNGNTAVVIKNVSTYTDESGAQYKYASTFGYFVGGSSATIKGTWVSIPCEENDGELECFGIGDGWKQTTLKISDNSISLTERYIPGEYDDYEDYDYEDYDYDDYDYYTDDVAQSGLMYSILKVLSGMRDYINSNYSMMENYSEDIEELQSELGIVVSSKSKNAETFVLNGKTYSLKVSKLVADFDRSDDLNLNMTISADGKSCNFYDEHVESISSSTCKADLKGYYVGTGSIYDNDENIIGKRVEYYSKDNTLEFTVCLQDLAGVTSGETEYPDDDEDSWMNDDEELPAYDDEYPIVNPLLKKSSSNKSSAAQFWRNYKRNMKKLRTILQ
jgi:hypothetical protein